MDDDGKGFEVGAMVMHRATQERGVVAEVDTACTVHSAWEHATGDFEPTQCSLEPIGTYTVSMSFEKALRGVPIEQLNVLCCDNPKHVERHEGGLLDGRTLIRCDNCDWSSRGNVAHHEG